jgi:hypothetical protein
MILEVWVLLVESVNGGGQRHHLLLVLNRRHWLDGLHKE